MSNESCALITVLVIAAVAFWLLWLFQWLFS